MVNRSCIPIGASPWLNQSPSDVSILFYCEGDDGQLLQTFRQRLPDHVIVDWTSERETTELHDITAAIVWMPPAEFFDNSPLIRTVYAFSAGVDSILQHPGLPENATIIRLRDAGMARQMAEYALYGVLYSQRQMGIQRLAQSKRQWLHNDVSAISATDTHVGILGAGALGLQVAERLALNDYPVCCWTRSARTVRNERVQCVHGQEALGGFLNTCHVLICLLPLTDATTGILNASLFDQLPPGAFLINPGRGAHLNEKDLLDALASGRISGALLDVFSTEPLPEDHPFWNHPDIIITPHVAAQSLPSESVNQVVNSIQTVEQGDVPAGVVDRSRGY